MEKQKIQKINYISKWFKVTGRSLVPVLCIAVILLSGSAYTLAQSPLAHRLGEIHGGDSNPGGEDVDIDPVENYHFVDKGEYTGVLLEKTEDAGKTYIDETLFIGDSNTARMNMYGFLSLDNVIGIESMGISGALNNKAVYFQGYNDPVTIAEAVGMMKPRRVIISFGTNDLGTANTESFINYYRDFIKAIQRSYQYTDIIIAAVPPFAKSLEGRSFSINTVNNYNKALIDLAKEMGLVYLDTGEVLTGTDGFIRPEYIWSDGIHITEGGFKAMFMCARTHSHIVDDARPKPLGKLPKQRPAPVVPKPPKAVFDASQAAGTALSLLVSAGYTAADNYTDWSNAQSVQWSISFSQAVAGSEQQIGQNLYDSVKTRMPYTSGYVAVSYVIDEDAEIYTFTVAVAPVHEHVWVFDKTITAATCTAAGVDQYKCSCGQKKTEPTPAKGHIWGPSTENSTGSGQWFHTCTVCGVTESVATPPGTGRMKKRE